MPDRSSQIRKEILFQCYGNRPLPRDAARMCRLFKNEGEMPDATPQEFTREAAYLVGKNLLEETRDDLDKGHVFYNITSEGVDYVEEHDLA